MQAPTGLVLHCDGKNDVNVFNAFVHFGDFKRGELLLWGLNLKVPLCCGDVFLFNSLSPYHNITALEGVRNSVNYFCHWTTICWAKKMMEREENSERQAKCVCYGQDWQMVDEERKWKEYCTGLNFYFNLSCWTLQIECNSFFFNEFSFWFQEVTLIVHYQRAWYMSPRLYSCWPIDNLAKHQLGLRGQLSKIKQY